MNNALQTGFESPREVAERLGWPLARIRKLIRSKQLRHVKIGGLYLIPLGATEEMVQAKMVDPNSTDLKVN